MSSAHSWRRSRIAGAGTIAAAVLAALLPAPAHAAALTGTITVTTPGNAKLAALTAKQVIVLTVSGAGVPPLSEDNVATLGLGPTPCHNLTTYVVTSPTTMTLKTPANCPAGTGDIVITFTNGDTLTKTNGITFVLPPGIDATAPVITDNSVFLQTPIKRFGTSGGQTVRVRAKSDFAFSPASASGLAASMGGKPGTSIKVYNDPAGSSDLETKATTPITAGTAGVNGNSMSFVTAAGMTPGDSGITLTQDGVSKTYLTADTGISIVAAPTVTSLSVSSGRGDAAAVSTVITGSNFSKVLADLQDPSKWLVKFCGVTATVTAASTTGNTMTVTVPDVAGVGTVTTGGSDLAAAKLNGLTTGLGTAVVAGVCPVTVTDLTVNPNQTSALTAGSHYTFLSE